MFTEGLMGITQQIERVKEKRIKRWRKQFVAWWEKHRPGAYAKSLEQVN